LTYIEKGDTELYLLFFFDLFLPLYRLIKYNDMVDFENISIERIQINEFAEAAKVLTDAFSTNAAYSLIFTHGDKLKDGLFWLFKTNLFLLNRKQKLTRVVKEKGSHEIIGLYTLIPPGGVKNNIVDYFRIGLFGFIRKFGFSTLLKMLGMDSYNKELLTKSIGAKEYYYLSMVALKDEYRGKGIGSYMIRCCLDELAKSKKDCRLLGLTTQLPENVTFYSRLGFRLIDEGEAIYKGDRYYNYNMKFNL